MEKIKHIPKQEKKKIITRSMFLVKREYYQKLYEKGRWKKSYKESSPLCIIMIKYCSSNFYFF